MIHYVCPVCSGVSEVPKTCGTAGCAHEGQPLQECTCADGEHRIVEPQAPSEAPDQNSGP